MIDQPSPSGDNGRAGNGRFAAGNRLAKGNPFAKRVAELRAALFDAVTPDDIRAVVQMLVSNAKAGDVASIKELLQRLLGPSQPDDLLERLESLESHIDTLIRAKSCRT